MLSESDKEFIKNNSDKSVEWLIEQTKRSKKDVEGFLQTLSKKNPLADRVRKQVSPKKGTSIMTGGVSGILDDTKNSKKNPPPYIHKIRPEE